MSMAIIFLGIEHDPRDFLSLEEMNCLGHKTRSNPLPMIGRVDGNSDEISRIAFQRIKLVANYLISPLRNDEIGMRGGNICKCCRIITPKIFKTKLF